MKKANTGRTFNLAKSKK
jgi:hypothetical protein